MALPQDRLPLGFLWVNVTNDLIWIPPFAAALAIVRWTDDPTTANQRSSELTLYQRVPGAKFIQMTPQLRRFHSARRSARVEGDFSVARGPSALGNKRTDLSGFPRSSANQPVSLTVTPTAGGEIWNPLLGPLVTYSGTIEITDCT